MLSEWARSCSLTLTLWKSYLEKKNIIPISVLGFQLTKFALYYYYWRLINKVLSCLAWPRLVCLTLPMCCRASGDDSLSLSLSFSLLVLAPEEIVWCLSSCHVRRGTRFHFMRDFGRSGKLTLEGGTLSLVHFFHNFFRFFSVTHPTKFSPWSWMTPLFFFKHFFN